MRVVVAWNDDLHLKPHLNEFERSGDAEVAASAKEIADLTGGELLAVRDVREALDVIQQKNPDVVFNLCEGVAGNTRWEMNFALALEMIGVAFTGCDPIAVGVCGDKALTKQLLSVNGISTPKGFAVSRAEDLADLNVGTWIVKPSREDAGIGVEPAAVCSSREEIRARCDEVIRIYRQPALVEEFIDGREFNQALFYSVAGDGAPRATILPPGEIVFDRSLTARERIVGWKAKWAAGSDEDRATVNVTPAKIDDGLRERISALCVRAATLLAIGGYARFDLRQGADGELFLVDINPQPDIGRETGFRKALSSAGIEFADFVEQLMIAALSRRRRA